MRYLDPRGDTIAEFSPDGLFMKYVDNGKTEWSGRFYQGSATRKVMVDGKKKDEAYYIDPIDFSFNDPAHDGRAIMNGEIIRVEFMSDMAVDEHIANSKVKGVPKGRAFGFALREGAGEMDYGVNGIKNRKLSSNTFYIQ